MNQHFLAFLGRQPEISLAELTAVTPPGNIAGHDSTAALLHAAPEKPDWLGGMVKLAAVFATTSSEHEIKEILQAYLLQASQQQPGKITLGISKYNLRQTSWSLGGLLASLKKDLKSTGRNVRLVFNNDQPLSPAQIFHNRLCAGARFEICLWRFNSQIHLARTIWVQNIEAYSRRDMLRKRNMRAGVLPPKLSQIMLNLAQTPSEAIVLDPFCGSGGVLQEALLRNCRVAGSDIDDRQMAACTTNLDRLIYVKNINTDHLLDLSVADATSHQWPIKAGVVVSELDLGPPLQANTSIRGIRPHKARLEGLLKQFLLNIAGQLAPSTRLCLALPAWVQPGEKYLTLNTVARLADLGYSLESSELIYCRSGQFVGRQLLIIKRI